MPINDFRSCGALFACFPNGTAWLCTQPVRHGAAISRQAGNWSFGAFDKKCRTHKALQQLAAAWQRGHQRR